MTWERCPSCGRSRSDTNVMTRFCRGRWSDRLAHRLFGDHPCRNGPHRHITCVWCGYSKVADVFEQEAAP